MMVENHNRKMTLPLLDQCTELIRSLAAAVGTNKVTFLERFNAHQKLIDRSGARDGDPEELSAAIDQATEALYGKDPEATVPKLARDRGDDDPAQAVGRFQSDASQVDRIEFRLTSRKLRAQQKPAEDANLADVHRGPLSAVPGRIDTPHRKVVVVSYQVEANEATDLTGQLFTYRDSRP